MVHFRGTPEETRICPRRHAIRNPWVYTAHDLFNTTGGGASYSKLGFTNRMSEALTVIGGALTWRQEANDE